MLEGLNDNTLAELDTVTVDKDGISMVGAVPQAVSDSTVVLDTTVSQAEINSDVELLPLIEQHDVWLQTEDSQQQQLSKLQDVTKTIMAAESISRTDIANALAEINDDELLSQFTSEIGSLAGFTALPTKSNLEETQAFFENRLEKMTSSLEDHYAAIRKENAANLKEACAVFNTYADKAIDELEALQVLATEGYAKSAISKNTLAFVIEKQGEGEEVRIDKKLVDIRFVAFNYDCEKVCPVLNLEPAVLQDFAQIYTNNQVLLKKITAYRAVQEKSRNYQLIGTSFEGQDSSDRHYMEIDYAWLLAFYQSGRLIHGLRFLTATLDQMLKKSEQEGNESGFSNVELSNAQANLFTYGKAISVIRSLNKQAVLILRAFQAVL